MNNLVFINLLGEEQWLTFRDIGLKKYPLNPYITQYEQAKGWLSMGAEAIALSGNGQDTVNTTSVSNYIVLTQLFDGGSDVLAHEALHVGVQMNDAQLAGALGLGSFGSSDGDLVKASKRSRNGSMTAWESESELHDITLCQFGRDRCPIHGRGRSGGGGG